MSDELDTSDIDRLVGVPLARNRTVEPIEVNDIRRWAQAMHHPNRLYYDAEYAAESRFGRIVAPQSFAIVCEAGHGARPATEGTIPDSHVLFAGDEWWFFGPRIVPGDRLTVEQMVYDYKKTTTSFAGPTVIQRGDNHYTNQQGEKVALQRSSAIRYRPETARDTSAPEPRASDELSDTDLDRIISEKEAYVRSIIELGHGPRPWAEVADGQELPVKVIGPHSIVSFATEWRAYTMNVWHAMEQVDYQPARDVGWTDEMSIRTDLAAWDPEFADGAYYGAARGHLSERFARQIGMAGPFGYGASLGAWVTDYLSSWAGEWGFVEHVAMQYRGSAFVGDVTYLRGVVSATSQPMDPDHGRVHVKVSATNQHGDVLVKAVGEVLLPRE